MFYTSPSWGLLTNSQISKFICILDVQTKERFDSFSFLPSVYSIRVFFLSTRVAPITFFELNDGFLTGFGRRDIRVFGYQNPVFRCRI